MPIAIKCRSEEVLYFQIDQRISLENLEAVLATGITGCRQIRSFVEDAIKSYMVETKAGL